MVRLGSGVRPVSGRVLFLGFLYVSRGLASAEHGLHVGVRLFVWRNAVVAPHGAGPGVVGGHGEHGPELVGEAAQVGDAGVDVLPGVEGVGDAEVALRVRHQLHHALGADGRLGAGAVPGLDGDDGVHQVGVDAVPPGGSIDDVGERPDRHDRLLRTAPPAPSGPTAPAASGTSAAVWMSRMRQRAWW